MKSVSQAGIEKKDLNVRIPLAIIVGVDEMIEELSLGNMPRQRVLEVALMVGLERMKREKFERASIYEISDAARLK